MSSTKRGLFLTSRTGLMLLAFSGMFLTSCSTNIKTQVLMPAKAPRVMTKKKVVVIPSRVGGGRFAFEMEKIISDAKVKGQPHYQLQSKDGASAAMMTRGYSAYGIRNREVQNVGKDLGVEAVFVPNYSESVRSSYSRTSNRVCSYYRNVKRGYGKNARYVRECASYRNETKVCNTKTANGFLRINMVDVKSASTIYSTGVFGSDSNTRCSTGNYAYASRPSAVPSILRQLHETFRKDIGPYNQMVSLEVLEEKDGLNPEGKEMLKAGVKMVDKGNIAGACRTWNDALRINPDAPSLIYNTGLCREIKAEFSEARKIFERAQSRFEKPNSTVEEGLARLRKLEDEKRKMQQELKRMEAEAAKPSDKDKKEGKPPKK